jgi:hypothetical protein
MLLTQMLQTFTSVLVAVMPFVTHILYSVLRNSKLVIV